MRSPVIEIEDRLFEIGERLFENEESFCSKRRLHIFSNFLTKKKGEIENSKNTGEDRQFKASNLTSIT